MLDLTHTLILSVVEGITEFLPISSTAHLELVSQLLQVAQSDFVKSFEIIIQLGAVLAVVLIYWQKLLTNFETLKKVVVAFLPTGILGLVLYKFVKQILLGNTLIAVAALFIGGILLIILEKRFKTKSQAKTIKDLTLTQSILIGLGQSVSMIPGVSRSASTIITGMLVGLERSQAVEFSFMVAIPTMLAATGYDFLKNLHNFQPDQFSALGIGFVGAFVTALIVVRWFLKYVQTNSLIPFGIYRILLAVIFWLYLMS